LNGLTLVAGKYDSSTTSFTYTSTGDYDYFICVIAARYSTFSGRSSLSVTNGEIVTNFNSIASNANAVVALIKLDNGGTVTMAFSTADDSRTYLVYGIS